MTPPSSVPVAPPAPFIAPHKPIARMRSGPAANVEVMIASEAGAMTAPPSPCAARAATSIAGLTAVPPSSEAIANMSRPAMNMRRWPNRSAARPPSMSIPANAIV